MTAIRLRRPPGFTLVELLVALAIFGFLSSLVFGGVGLAIRSWTRAHDQVAGTADVWAVQGLLRRSLSGAYPALASRSAGDATIDFDGEPDALTLVAPMPQAVAVPVPARLRFFLAPDGRSRALVMAWLPDLSPGQAVEAPLDHRLKLLDRVRAIGFEYFGPPRGGGGAVWQPRWSGRDRLPDLIRITLRREGAGTLDWPTLLVEPKSNLDRICKLDPVADSCRGIP